jgi:hypothetical protein
MDTAAQVQFQVGPRGFGHHRLRLVNLRPLGVNLGSGMITVDQAQSIAAALLRARPSACEPFLPSAGGADSTSFRLRFGGERMLLTVKRRTRSPVGIYFHARLRAAGLPVPELLAFSPDGGPRREACAIWEWIEGLPAEWGPGEACPYDEADFGELLLSIHSLSFDGAYGFLGDDLARRTFSLPGLGPVSPDWPSFFHCDALAGRYLEAGYINMEEARVLASLPDRLVRELGNRPRRLLHMGDVMHNGNMLVDPGSGRIRAILDFSESTAGDPRWELAWVHYYFADLPGERRKFDLDRFWSGYGGVFGSDDVLGCFYLAAVLLFEKLLFYDPASGQGRWAIATVRRILRNFA